MKPPVVKPWAVRMPESVTGSTVIAAVVPGHLHLSFLMKTTGGGEAETASPESGTRGTGGGETLQVHCYAGYRGEEEPRELIQAGRTLEVVEIVDRWLEPGRRCFRIRIEDGEAVLTHEEARDQWRLR